jgi:hypothetical protein
VSDPVAVRDRADHEAAQAKASMLHAATLDRAHDAR